MSKIYGVPVSPFVRKVMLAHAFKDADFQLAMVMPGSDDAEFRQASPFGKIPGYKTEQGTCFADSSAIIAYLEKDIAEPPLYPENAEDYGRSLWFEEFADTKLAEACNALYYQHVIGPKFFDHTPDDERVKQIKEALLPPVLRYLEQELTNDAWLINNCFSVADLSIGCFMMGLDHAKYVIDVNAFPKTANFYKRFARLDFVQAQLEQESAMLFS